MKNKYWMCGWLGLGLVAGINLAQGASVEKPPEVENFQSGELPHDVWHPPYPPFILFGYWTYSPWNFTTNGEARTAIAYDETDAHSSSLPGRFYSALDANEATGSNRARGNYYRCDTSGVLHSFSAKLDRNQNMSIDFLVYESSTSNGTYSVVSSNRVVTATGDGNVSSGAIDVPFAAGHYYLLSTAWSDELTYHYMDSGYQPFDVSFGASMNGFTGSYPAPSSISGSFNNLLYFQTVEFSTNAVVRMDDWEGNSTYSTNQMDLAVDLSGYTDVTLRFRHRDSSDEHHTGDGIFLSNDSGNNFTKIYDLNSSATWQTLTLDINALASNAGLPLTANMIIRFQQMDNYSWPDDGREFDDIQLFSTPDLDVYYLGVASEFLWKGFDSIKQVPLSVSVRKRGGENDLSAPSVTFRYGIFDGAAPPIVSDYEYTTSAWTIPAWGQNAQAANHTLSIPAATHMADLYYTASVYADSNNTVTEGNESNNYRTKQVTVNHYSGWLWFDDVKADITISDWGTRVADSPSEHWITGTGTLGGESFSFTNLMVVKNLTTLDYSLDPTETTHLNVPITDPQEVNHITYWHTSGVDLSKNGAYSTIKLLLPCGLGITTTFGSPVLESTYTFSNTKLTQDLYPASVQDAFGTFYISEETKPLSFRVTAMEWDPSDGTLWFQRDGVNFVREPFLLSLEAYSDLMEDPSMAVKKSNCGYYRGTYLVDEDITVNAGNNGEAQLSTLLKVAPQSFITHFPYGVEQAWMDQALLRIHRDLIISPESYFTDMKNCSISYARDCAEADCSGGAIADTLSLKIASSGVKTFIGQEGGLLTAVDIDGGATLKWGSRDGGKFAQTASNFDSGRLYIAGHFIRGDLSGFDATSQRGPAEILLGGLYSSTKERPSQTNYANGLADYAGLNLRVGNDSRKGQSIIGGTQTPEWPLSSRSKYYLRASGVSGIHEASAFNETMHIYDYPFSFSNLGLSYLSGTPQESRINGSVVVKEPCEITMDFEELKLCCLGELEEAELANSDTKTLKYWDADIQPLSLFFAPTANSSCANQARKLCMGLTTQCANVDQVLSGTLGFLPSGNLASPADQIEGVPSRLASPNKIELAGPGDEIYYFNPVANPYYNDFAQSGDAATDRGWINFAGKVDVSFFEDLLVQLHTSASTNSAVAKIYMMGGWEEDGKTFFSTTDPDGFDLSNRGFPPALTNYASYRTPSDDDYRVRAKRTWLGVINFDYPLDWSSSTKAFKSPEELQEDLLVVQVQHQTDYLSAERTEISFGMQYDGVPQINLANMAFNAVDESTGMMSAFVDSVGAGIHDAIDDGMSAFEDTLSDLPEQLFDPVFDIVLDPLVDEFYTDLYEAYTNQPTATDFGSVVTQYLYGVTGSTFDNVGVVISNLADTASDAVNLLDEIDGNLDKAVQLINAFADVVSMTNGVVLPEDAGIKGLLSADGGNYQELTDLGIGILETLSETLYDSIKGTVEEKLTEVLTSVAPSLESITEVMLELRDVIEEVQTHLATAGSVAAELRDVLQSPLVANTLDTIAEEIMRQMETLSAGDSSFDEYTPAEVKAMLRQYITDAFYSSTPCADVQQVIRSQLYELEAMVQESIDSVFQQLNKAMKDLVSEYLAGIDEEINGALDGLSDVMGAGQIDGYAHIRNDSLNELRLDGKFQWKVPDEMEFNAFLIIKDLNSSLPGGCGVDADSLPEVTLGTTDFGMGMLGSDIRANIDTKFAFAEEGDSLRLIGLGGKFEMTEGEIGFESFAIDKFYAAVAFGEMENYLSANVHCTFTSYEVEGGLFLGKACSLDPFSWDPDVQGVLGDPPFTGVYVYGEGWMPIVDYGCLFRVKAGVGAGFFYFVDGPVGGKIFLGADGEALCVVNVSGEVTLVGVKDGDDMRMLGKGKISGRAGSCPFCIKFSKTATITYENGKWDADY